MKIVHELNSHSLLIYRPQNPQQYEMENEIDVNAGNNTLSRFSNEMGKKHTKFITKTNPSGEKMENLCEIFDKLKIAKLSPERDSCIGMFWECHGMLSPFQNSLLFFPTKLKGYKFEILKTFFFMPLKMYIFCPRGCDNIQTINNILNPE